MTDHDPIYVGYRPMPPRLRSRVAIIVTAFLTIGALAAAITARSLSDSGASHWNTADQTTLTGTARLTPYPHLATDTGPVLLAEPGKFGAQSRIAPLDGQSIRVTGTLLTRGPFRAIEITNAESLGESAEVEPAVIEISEITNARGEILDSKCYLGAMKPGDGPAHKACAILCLRGGIAPLFIGTSATGQPVAAVLCGPGASPLDPAALTLAGEPVLITGTLATLSELPILIVARADIRKAND